MKNITNFFKTLFRIESPKIKSSKRIQQIARRSMPPENVVEAVDDHLCIFRKPEKEINKQDQDSSRTM